MIEYNKLLTLILDIKNKQPYEVYLEKYKYLINQNQISEKDFKFLFNLIKSDYNINENIIANIFINSFTTVENKIYINETKGDDIIIKKDLIYKNIFLNLVDKYGTIEALPKNIVVLWNDNKSFKGISDIITTLISNTENTETVSTLIKFRYINFKTINKKLLNSYEDILTMKSYSMYNHLNRIVGIKTSLLGYKLNYELIIKLSNNDNDTLIYNLSDYYAGKVKINIEGLELLISIKKVNEIIDKYYPFIIDKLIKEKKVFLYSKLLMFLFQNNKIDITTVFDKIKAFEKKIIKDKSYLKKREKIKEYVYVEEFEEIKIDMYKNNNYCEHEEEYSKILKITKDYNHNLNVFVGKYINMIGGLPICVMCGETLTFFNIIQQTFIKNKSDFIQTITVENIFKHDEYNRFIDIRTYMMMLLDNFDNIFKTSKLSAMNNITRLLVDFYIDISENRLIYEKKFSNEVKNGDIFILRLSQTFFIYDAKEFYFEKKLINMTIINLMTILINIGLNELFGIIKQLNIELETLDEIFIELIYRYYSKQKLLNYFQIKEKVNKAIYKNKITKMYNIYKTILTDELANMYKLLKINFDLNKVRYDTNKTEFIIYKRLDDKVPKVYNLSDKIIKNTKKVYSYNNFEYDLKDSDLKFSKNIEKVYFFKKELNKIDLTNVLKRIDKIKLIYYYNNKKVDKVIDYDTSFLILVDNISILLSKEDYLKSVDIITTDHPMFTQFDIEIDINDKKDKKDTCYYILFNYGNYLPFSKKDITNIHLDIIINKFKNLINKFFKNINIEKDINKTIFSYEDIIEIKYNILQKLTNNNIDEFIDKNCSKIIKMID